MGRWRPSVRLKRGEVLSRCARRHSEWTSPKGEPPSALAKQPSLGTKLTMPISWNETCLGPWLIRELTGVVLIRSTSPVRTVPNDEEVLICTPS
jgi:hypothetical protein